MYKMKVWWSGHVLLTKDVKDLVEAKSEITDLKNKLISGELILKTSGSDIMPTSLCVDVLDENKKILLLKNL